MGFRAPSGMAVSSRVPLRVGLLGYGAAGSVFHAPLIAIAVERRRSGQR